MRRAFPRSIAWVTSLDTVRTRSNVWMSSWSDATSRFWATTIRRCCLIPKVSIPLHCGRFTGRGDQLESGPGGPDVADQRWDWIGELPRKIDEGEILFVHGSPRDATNEYVFPEHALEADKMNSLMGRFDGLCFQGHTHIPGVFAMTQDDEEPDRREYTFLAPEERDNRFRLDSIKAMINVGSVGQPRDENPRACYVVLDLETKELEFRRVTYDVQTTRSKIHAIEELDNMLGDRLLAGR